MFEHGRKLTGMYIWMSVIGVQKVSQSAQYVWMSVVGVEKVSESAQYEWMSVVGVEKVSQSAQYDDDDDCFYIALFSSLEQTHCARLLTSD